MADGFAQFVKDAMDKQGLSLRQLAKEMNVQPSFLSRVFTGHRKNLPSDEVILQMAGILKIDPPSRLLAEAGRVTDHMKSFISSPIFLKSADSFNKKEREEVLSVIEKIMKRKEKLKKAK